VGRNKAASSEIGKGSRSSYMFVGEAFIVARFVDVAYSKTVRRTYKIIVLPIVLYGFETGFVTSREEHILKAFENSVRRRVSGPTKVDRIGSWKKLPNEELHNLYSSQNIIRMNNL
jgi:hypothetical protein